LKHGPVTASRPGSTVVGGHQCKELVAECDLEFVLCTYLLYSARAYKMPNGKFTKRKSTLLKVRKKLKKTGAPRPVSQATGSTARKAFGTSTKVPRSLPLDCWNAFSSSHAALPRSVGPYTVVRTSRLITTKSPLIVFGTYSSLHRTTAASTTPVDYGPKAWTNVIAAQFTESVTKGTKANFETAAIGFDDVTDLLNIPSPVSYDGTLTYSSMATMCPAAISVQLLNPEQFTNAEGQMAAAVCPVRIDLCNTTTTWKAVADQVVSYMRPRMLSGGKLVFKGVQMDSHPLSMSDVSDFRHTLEFPTDKIQCTYGNTGTNPCSVHPEGWAPMVYYNGYNASKEPADRKSMSFLVCVEWRVRFDLANPAVASHRHHGVSDDYAWDRHIRRAADALPGVIDIVEKVATSGLGLAKMYNAAIV
jgi:hypothetical protein